MFRLLYAIWPKSKDLILQINWNFVNESLPIHLGNYNAKAYTINGTRTVYTYILIYLTCKTISWKIQQWYSPTSAITVFKSKYCFNISESHPWIIIKTFHVFLQSVVAIMKVGIAQTMMGGDGQMVAWHLAKNKCLFSTFSS